MVGGADKEEAGIDHYLGFVVILFPQKFGVGVEQEQTRHIKERERRVHDNKPQLRIRRYAGHIKFQKPGDSNGGHQQGGIDQINDHGKMIHHQTPVRVRQNIEKQKEQQANQQDRQRNQQNGSQKDPDNAQDGAQHVIPPVCRIRDTHGGHHPVQQVFR